ncbi:hypothetical protein HDV06_001249 [Boothiomyces sp. JEL0866]|nr:hypothetical protein HDV06_001249 [Boothiomyces sp. JEL0866]
MGVLNFLHAKPAVAIGVALGVAGPILLAFYPALKTNTVKPIPFSYPFAPRERVPTSGFEDE